MRRIRLWAAALAGAAVLLAGCAGPGGSQSGGAGSAAGGSGASSAAQGAEETFVCVCGYKERLSAFKARREKEGAGVNKRDVQNYLRRQQKEAKEPVNNAFAQALAGLKLDGEKKEGK